VWKLLIQMQMTFFAKPKSLQRMNIKELISLVDPIIGTLGTFGENTLGQRRCLSKQRACGKSICKIMKTRGGQKWVVSGRQGGSDDPATRCSGFCQGTGGAWGTAYLGNKVSKEYTLNGRISGLNGAEQD
jgi:hypothetical protein